MSSVSDTIAINTAQNAVIHYEIAGPGERMLAAFYDQLFKAGWVLAAFFAVGSLSSAPRYVIGVLIVIFAIPFIFYSLAFEILMNGQTPGKRMRKIKVVKEDGGPAGVGDYLIRWVFRLIDINLFSAVVGILAIVLSQKKQRIGDMLAKTVVIKVPDRVSLKDTLYEKINDTYVPKYEAVKKLDPSDIEVIKKVLNNPSYRENFDLYYTLTNRIQTKMDVMRTEAPEEFLETVVKDYNYFSGQ